MPRGRVYANYVSRCATERVTVLNPASFGKLVRVLFPGLKTRRLGVRGESKYHYVNFSLKDDQPELTETQKHQPLPTFTETQSFATSFKYVSSYFWSSTYPLTFLVTAWHLRRNIRWTEQHSLHQTFLKYLSQRFNEMKDLLGRTASTISPRFLVFPNLRPRLARCLNTFALHL